MPHPKNRLKLTGDTHLPEHGLELDLDLSEDEPAEALPEEDMRVYADGYTPSPEQALPKQQLPAQGLAEAQPEPGPEPEHPSRVEALERSTGRRVSRKPWVAIGAGLLFGWMVARILRH